MTQIVIRNVPGIGYVEMPASYDAADITREDVAHDGALRVVDHTELTEDVCAVLEGGGELLEARVHERGQGLPDEGDYVAGDDGEVYQVVTLRGPIQTGPAGVGNWILARVAPADWVDIDDDNEPVCSAVLDDSNT